MHSEIQTLLDLSKRTAGIALDRLIELGKKDIKQYSFDVNIPRETKAIADTIIENIILDKLIPTGINILSEETGLLVGNKGSSLRFIIDPIDGTVNFVRGIADCSICIALFDGDKPIFGVIATYPNGSIAWGGKGLGAFLDSTRLQVSKIEDFKKSVLCTGFPSRFKFDEQSFLLQTKLMSQFGKTRMLGAASQSLLQVAKGSVECYSEQNIMLWDVAAGISLVEGAGGRVEVTSVKPDYVLNITADNGYIKCLEV